MFLRSKLPASTHLLRAKPNILRFSGPNKHILGRFSHSQSLYHQLTGKLLCAPKLHCTLHWIGPPSFDVAPKLACAPQASMYPRSFQVLPKLPCDPQASMCNTSFHVPPKLPCTSKHPCAPKLPCALESFPVSHKLSCAPQAYMCLQASMCPPSFKMSPELTTTTLTFLILS